MIFKEKQGFDVLSLVLLFWATLLASESLAHSQGVVLHHFHISQVTGSPVYLSAELPDADGLGLDLEKIPSFQSRLEQLAPSERLLVIKKIESHDQSALLQPVGLELHSRNFLPDQASCAFSRLFPSLLPSSDIEFYGGPIEIHTLQGDINPRCSQIKTFDGNLIPFGSTAYEPYPDNLLLIEISPPKRTDQKSDADSFRVPGVSNPTDLRELLSGSYGGGSDFKFDFKPGGGGLSNLMDISVAFSLLPTVREKREGGRPVLVLGSQEGVFIEVIDAQGHQWRQLYTVDEARELLKRVIQEKIPINYMPTGKAATKDNSNSKESSVSTTSSSTSIKKPISQHGQTIDRKGGNEKKDPKTTQHTCNLSCPHSMCRHGPCQCSECLRGASSTNPGGRELQSESQAKPESAPLEYKISETATKDTSEAVGAKKFSLKECYQQLSDLDDLKCDRFVLREKLRIMVVDLGVAKNTASDDKMRRQLILRLHPDKNTEDQEMAQNAYKKCVDVFEKTIERQQLKIARQVHIDSEEICRILQEVQGTNKETNYSQQKTLFAKATFKTNTLGIYALPTKGFGEVLKCINWKGESFDDKEMAVAILGSVLVEYCNFGQKPDDGVLKYPSLASFLCYWSVRYNQPAMLMKLLKQDMKVANEFCVSSKTGNVQFSPLTLAVTKKDMECARLLIEYGGADPTLMLESKTTDSDAFNPKLYNWLPRHSKVPLLFHVRSPDMLKYLLSKGVNPNQTDSSGWTLLQYIARGMLDQVSESGISGLTLIPELLRGHANLEVKDRQGNTPLHTACSELNLLLVIDILTTPAADSKAGKTSLVSLGDLSQSPNAGLLNIPNREGDTPLHIAARSHNPDLVKVLCSAGADPSIKNVRGESALQTALREVLLRESPRDNSYTSMVRQDECLSLLMRATARDDQELIGDQFCEVMAKQLKRSYDASPFMKSSPEDIDYRLQHFSQHVTGKLEHINPHSFYKDTLIKTEKTTLEMGPEIKRYLEFMDVARAGHKSIEAANIDNKGSDFNQFLKKAASKAPKSIHDSEVTGIGNHQSLLRYQGKERHSVDEVRKGWSSSFKSRIKTPNHYNEAMKKLKTKQDAMVRLWARYELNNQKIDKQKTGISD